MKTSHNEPLLIHQLIERIWERGKFVEPMTYPRSDTGFAISQLCSLANLTHADLAKICSVTPAYFRNIEIRNSNINPVICETLQRLALDFYLPRLSDWFKARALQEYHNKRANKRWGL